MIQYVAKKVNEYLNRMAKTQTVDFNTYSDTDSVTGDSIIELESGRQTIESMFNDVDTVPVKSQGDNIVKPVFGINAVGVDSSGSPVVRPIKYIMKHKVKKEMFRITVGKDRVICTADHSLIVVRNGKLISVTPSEVISTDKFIKLCN